MIDVAALIESGLALVPIPYGQKGPCVAGWNQRAKAVTRVRDAPLLSGMNVGIAHAYCTPCPTAALDVDSWPKAKAWLSAKGIDLMALIEAPSAVVIWSGKRNSMKLLYRLPAGLAPLPSKTITAVGSEREVLLEFRCATKTGLTVQDVLPPSLHPAGEHYQWLGKGSALDIPVIPSSLLEVWQHLLHKAPGAAKSQNARAKRDDGPWLLPPPMEETPRNLAVVYGYLNQINADCSYETYLRVIWALESLQWPCTEDIQRNWSRSAAHRFEETTLQKLKNSYSTRDGHVGFGTLVYLALRGQSATHGVNE